MNKQPDLHFDVNGKWGGDNAVIAHINGKDYIYLRIGEYWAVGLGPEDYSPSQWNICEKFVKFSQTPTAGHLAVILWYSIKFICKKYKWYRKFIDLFNRVKR